MTTSINTNISAFFGQNNLRASSAEAQSSIARLSSGNAIIRAADDVAGLSVGTILRTDVNTLKTALSNANQASSLIQVADGAIERLGEILQRQKALAVQGNADTLSDTERGYLNQEFQALTSEYDRIVTRTEFNGVSLLDGNLTGTAQAAGDADDVATTDYTVGGTGTEITALTIAGLGGDASNGADAIDAFFADSTRVATITADVYAATDLVFDASGSTLVTAASFTTIGSDATENATIRGFAQTDIDNATISTANGGVGDSLVTITITIGGVAFVGVADEIDTNSDNPARDFTSANGSVISVDFATLALTDGSDVSTVQASFRDITLTNNAPANDTTASISIVGGTTTFANTAVNLADSQGAFTFTDGTSGATITLNFGDLGITGAAGIGTNSAAIQTGINALTATNGFSADAVTGAAAFQVGIASTDVISVDIADLSAATVGTSTLDVSTKGDVSSGAIAASAALDTAINTVTQVRASVGAIQSRFDFAAATLESSITNLDAARAGFLDADISQASTQFAQEQVLIQASISVLAQANQLPQNLLKLIG